MKQKVMMVACVLFGASLVMMGCEQKEAVPTAEELAQAEEACPESWKALYDLDRLQAVAVQVDNAINQYEASTGIQLDIPIVDTSEPMPSACEPLKVAYDALDTENRSVSQQLETAKLEEAEAQLSDPAIVGIYSNLRLIIVSVQPGQTAYPPPNCWGADADRDREDIRFGLGEGKHCEPIENDENFLVYVGWTVVTKEK